MNALITMRACKVNSKIKDKKVLVLEAILNVEKGKTDNLIEQNKLWADDYAIKDKQATEWKAEYKQCTEELIEAKDWPWYKFDLKSVVTGVIIPIAIKVIWFL